jgi:hypothetical protein
MTIVAMILQMLFECYKCYIKKCTQNVYKMSTEGRMIAFICGEVLSIVFRARKINLLDVLLLYSI